MTTRKQFLKTAAALAAAGAYSPRALGADFDPSSWASVRDQFELDDGVTNLSTFLLASHPKVVRDAIERRLAVCVSTAGQHCPSITAKRVTAHTLRHTAAMRLLLAGNDITVIALWLGHEQVTTTQIYLHADMSHKQRAIDRTKPLAAKPGRYRPSDSLLAFLVAL